MSENSTTMANHTVKQHKYKNVGDKHSRDFNNYNNNNTQSDQRRPPPFQATTNNNNNNNNKDSNDYKNNASIDVSEEIKAVETGSLIKFINLHDFSIFNKLDYVQKHSYLLKHGDGTWKFALKIGTIKQKIIVELRNGDICNVNAKHLFAYDSELLGKRWRG